VEKLALARGVALKKDSHYQALVARDGGLWLVMPQTFMNASGRAVQMLTGFFKIPPEEILVVHDELDFPPGVARLKQGGGIAGHNGLKDISQRLGSHDYWRLRLGVGRPAGKDGADYVLEKPPAEEREAIEGAIARALEVMPQILAGDLLGAMQKLHGGDKPALAKPEEPKPEAKKPEAAKKTEAAKAAARKAEPAMQGAKKAEAKAPEANKPEAKAPQPAPAAQKKEEKAGGLKGFFKGLTGSKK
jgi:peptidyl-tRNA hydrolase, PTH1 family